MGRLTIKKIFDYYDPNIKTTTVCVDGYTQIGQREDLPYGTTHYYLVGEAIDKLAEYEDLEEQGLLLKLPCKVGDDIWCIEEFADGFDISCYRFMAMSGDYCLVTSFFQHCESYEVQLEEMVDDCQNWGHTDVTIFHKGNVFLTKAEAEKALEEMEK